MSGRVFLAAEWRDLVMLNYEVEPKLLTDYVPRGTELDAHDGKTYLTPGRISISAHATLWIPPNSLPYKF